MNVRMRASYSDNRMPRCEETLLMAAAAEPDHNRHRRPLAAQDSDGNASRTRIDRTCKTTILWTHDSLNVDTTGAQPGTPGVVASGAVGHEPKASSRIGASSCMRATGVCTGVSPWTNPRP